MTTKFDYPEAITKKHYPGEPHYSWRSLNGVRVYTLFKDGTNTEIRALFLNQTKRGITLETDELTGYWKMLTLYPSDWEW